MYKNRLQDLRDSYETNNKTKLKQSDISKMLNLKKDTYGEYEREKSIIPTKHLNYLSNFYKVSIDYILGFTNTTYYKNAREDINKNLQSARLKELRKEKDLTQEKLAKNINVAKSTISEYERTTNIISTSILYEICKKYKISADYLLGKVDNPKKY